MDICKLCKHSSDATKYLHCLPTGIYSQNTVKVRIFTQTPKITNGLIQMKRMDKSIGQKRDKNRHPLNKNIRVLLMRVGNDDSWTKFSLFPIEIHA